MKKAIESGNVVAAVSGLEKFKYDLSTAMDEELRGSVALGMRDMLGNPQAIPVRVSAD